MISNKKAIKFLSLAKHMADTFSKDKEKKVGCFMLDPNTLFIRSTAYNGCPINVQDTDERWKRPNKSSFVVHSEVGAICAAARHGTSLDGSICVVTLFPCSSCARALIQTGIRTVVTNPPDFKHERWGNEFKIAYELFTEAGVELMYPIENNELGDSQTTTEPGWQT